MGVSGVFSHRKKRAKEKSGKEISPTPQWLHLSSAKVWWGFFKYNLKTKSFVLISYVHWMPKEWVRWSKRNNPKLRRAPQGPNGCFAITKRGSLINLSIGLVYWHDTLDCEKKIRLTRKKKKQPKALRGSTGYQWAARVYKRAALVYKRAARPRPQVRSEPAAMTVTQVYDSQRFHRFPPFFLCFEH